MAAEARRSRHQLWLQHLREKLQRQGLGFCGSCLPSSFVQAQASLGTLICVAPRRLASKVPKSKAESLEARGLDAVAPRKVVLNSIGDLQMEGPRQFSEIVAKLWGSPGPHPHLGSATAAVAPWDRNVRLQTIMRVPVTKGPGPKRSGGSGQGPSPPRAAWQARGQRQQPTAPTELKSTRASAAPSSVACRCNRSDLPKPFQTPSKPHLISHLISLLFPLPMSSILISSPFPHRRGGRGENQAEGGEAARPRPGDISRSTKQKRYIFSSKQKHK